MPISDDHGADAQPPAEVVTRFLRAVRSGQRLDLAATYLAEEVLAHQGAYGTDCPVVARSPESYAQHVADMHAATGPWRFEITGLVHSGELVDATWRQVGSHRAADGAQDTQIEHGQATYLVRDGRIREYWIEFLQHLGPCLPTARECSLPGE